MAAEVVHKGAKGIMLLIFLLSHYEMLFLIKKNVKIDFNFKENNFLKINLHILR